MNLTPNPVISLDPTRVSINNCIRNVRFSYLWILFVIYDTLVAAYYSQDFILEPLACIYISQKPYIYYDDLAPLINRSCAKPLQRKCSMCGSHICFVLAHARHVCSSPPPESEPEKWLSLLFELHSIDLNNVVNYTAGEHTGMAARASNGKQVSRRLQNNVGSKPNQTERNRPNSVCLSVSLSHCRMPSE